LIFLKKSCDAVCVFLFIYEMSKGVTTLLECITYLT